ncbi:MAG: FAD-dependent monooxygenase [Pseudomonadota bacterium]
MLSDRPVTVLGAGIGGLAAASALAQRGARVRVLEQAAEIREVGAGLQISPNGLAVLCALGLDTALAERSVAAERIILHNADGRRLQVLSLDRLPLPLPWLLVHRADLIAVLAEAARQAGVEIVLDAGVRDVRVDNEAAALVTADGATDSAPLLVGADGLRSVTRGVVAPESRARFTGQTAWRAIVPLDDPAPPQVRVYLGAGRHVVAYPLRDRRQMNLVAVVEEVDWREETWSHEGDADLLRFRFRDFGDGVRDLLDRVEVTHVWGLFRHPVARPWHRGPVALLGDAAHPTLPFLAQGACMALEDAWVLAACLDAAPSHEVGFAAYEDRRRARCVRIVAGANRNARLFHLRDGPVRMLAHSGLKIAGTLAPHFALRQFNWLYGEDVTAG